MKLDVVKMALLPHLDGSHDRGMLEERLHAAVRDGRITLFDNATGAPIRDREALERAVCEHAAGALENLAITALLEPPNGRDAAPDPLPGRD